MRDSLPPGDCSLFDRVFKVSRSDLVTYEHVASATPDLLDWPTGLGAPTVDKNGEPIDLLSLPLAQRVDRVIDLSAGERPDITGHQMLWWVQNDRGNVHERSNAPPLGIETHVSAFAYNVPGPLGNTTFYRFKLFYKGEEPATDTYFGVFSDPDLGNFDDDPRGQARARQEGFSNGPGLVVRIFAYRLATRKGPVLRPNLPDRFRDKTTTEQHVNPATTWGPRGPPGDAGRYTSGASIRTVEPEPAAGTMAH